jgi:hypothetical protein
LRVTSFDPTYLRPDEDASASDWETSLVETGGVVYARSLPEDTVEPYLVFINGEWEVPPVKESVAEWLASVIEAEKEREAEKKPRPQIPPEEEESEEEEPENPVVTKKEQAPESDPESETLDEPEYTFDLEDVQNYYDDKIASGMPSPVAAKATKEHFDLPELKINPVGKVLEQPGLRSDDEDDDADAAEDEPEDAEGIEQGGEEENAEKGQSDSEKATDKEGSDDKNKTAQKQKEQAVKKADSPKPDQREKKDKTSKSGSGRKGSADDEVSGDGEADQDTEEVEEAIHDDLSDEGDGIQSFEVATSFDVVSKHGYVVEEAGWHLLHQTLKKVALLEDGWGDDKKVISTKKHDGYEVRKERYVLGGDDAIEIDSAYTPEGHYIGSPEDAEKLTQEYGIKPELAKPDNAVCSVGKSSKDGKWYGWSHRAISGFKSRDAAVKFAKSVS